MTSPLPSIARAALVVAVSFTSLFSSAASAEPLSEIVINEASQFDGQVPYYSGSVMPTVRMLDETFSEGPAASVYEDIETWSRGFGPGFGLKTAGSQLALPAYVFYILCPLDDEAACFSLLYAAQTMWDLGNEIDSITTPYTNGAVKELEFIVSPTDGSWSTADNAGGEQAANTFTQLSLVLETAGDLIACAPGFAECLPTGDVEEVGEDVVDEAGAAAAAAIALAMDAVEDAEEAAGQVLAIAESLGGDVSETGEATIELVNGQIDNVFSNLNSTLSIVFAELNYVVETLPEEARTSAQFVVDTANAEIELLVGLAQQNVLFAVGLAESVGGTTFGLASIVQKAVYDVADSLPLYDNEEAYQTAISQAFFALDNLVLRFLDEDRTADQAVIAMRDGGEQILRAGGGYTRVLKPGGQIDYDEARNTTLAISDATVRTLVALGYTAVSQTGYEAVYEDMVCNRLQLCD